MAKTLRKAMWALLALIFLFISLNGICGSTFAAPASAASNVLEDLHKDENFDLNKYPEVENDYSLKVIQIAESSDDELFIYVYQPAASVIELTATSINLSLADNIVNDGQSLNTTLYSLTLLNSAGVFQKYRVEDLTVSSKSTRHYNITSIYRAWNKDIDKGVGNDNKVDEVVFEVAQKWTATTQFGETVYAMTEAEVITITRKRCGFIRYPEGVKHNTAIGACDGHFVAFSCDRKIDKLLAARVSFVEQTYAKTMTGTSEGTAKPNEKYIVHGEYASNTPALFGKPKSWERIQTGADFAKNATDLEEDVRTDLATYQYVLNFYETTYEASKGSLGWAAAGILFPLFFIPAFASLDNNSGTAVTDVTILELTFEKDGEVYTLGVVDNKQSGPRKPLNESNKGLPLWVIIVIIVVVACIALVVLSVVFPTLGLVLKQILQGVGWLITAPFRGIAALVRKRKEAAPAKVTPSKSRKRKTPKKKSSTSRTSSTRNARTRSKAK